LAGALKLGNVLVSGLDRAVAVELDRLVADDASARSFLPRIISASSTVSCVVTSVSPRPWRRPRVAAVVGDVLVLDAGRLGDRFHRAVAARVDAGRAHADRPGFAFIASISSAAVLYGVLGFTASVDTFATLRNSTQSPILVSSMPSTA
jgi:hypothetical protein